MNTSCTTTSLSVTATPVTPAKTPAAGGLFASLERLINTAGFVSVDLTDTILASLPRSDGAPYEAVVKTNCSE